ncbi:hypothetical protein ACQPZJ_29125 [Actinoplanes sp. CA-054009]
MDYDGLEALISGLVERAEEEALRAFGRETVARVLGDEEQRELITGADLDAGGRRALDEVRGRVRSAGAAELRDGLRRVQEGVLTDGDMDFPLVNFLDAVDQWATFLETGEREAVRELAMRAVDQIDFRVEADLSDVLASPEMAAEVERVNRLLGGAETLGTPGEHG